MSFAPIIELTLCAKRRHSAALFICLRDRQ
jgi:hypothetical protein